ncbi:hypothetical protein AX774_g6622 [Zancudomyces culisetae]|uniref:Uncharacterized protein n=1 Tax=Zancudomyces culisetae TaxID=1213189 RepID=A0A1R1PGA8_ZANCU|nr:hypothetical protein AX774_g6622 [Zancudomyces culisetae]|eukprot:OMH79953.1 hypothetical protein AX774_g6622 [Zancudomyces culisetae]
MTIKAKRTRTRTGATVKSVTSTGQIDVDRTISNKLVMKKWKKIVPQYPQRIYTNRKRLRNDASIAGKENIKIPIVASKTRIKTTSPEKQLLKKCAVSVVIDSKVSENDKQTTPTTDSKRRGCLTISHPGQTKMDINRVTKKCVAATTTTTTSKSGCGVLTIKKTKQRDQPKTFKNNTGKRSPKQKQSKDDIKVRTFSFKNWVGVSNVLKRSQRILKTQMTKDDEACKIPYSKICAQLPSNSNTRDIRACQNIGVDMTANIKGKRNQGFKFDNKNTVRINNGFFSGKLYITAKK